MDTFSVRESVGFGWRTFKKRPWFFVGISLLIAILSGIASSLASLFSDDGGASLIGTIVNIGLSTLIGMGSTAFFLKAHEAPDAVQSADLWHPSGFWQYLAATLLAGCSIVIGLILLIVPGIILALMFMFVSYIVIDRSMGPIEALQESRRITDGHKWNLLGFALALIGINILGLLCLVVGLLVSVPVSSLAIVHAYRVLSAKAGAPVPVGAA